MRRKYDPRLLDEIEGIIDIRREQHDKSSVPIIYDGRQYTIKVPKRMALRAELSAKDRFQFVVRSSITKAGKMTRLEGELIVDEDKHTSQE